MAQSDSKGESSLPAGENSPLQSDSADADFASRPQGTSDRIPAAFESPLRFQMLRSFPMPMPMPSFRSILNGAQLSPISVHVLPFSNNGLGSLSDFYPVSRPLRSLRELSQGSPLFSRSITITSDGSKTVRQETSRDADGNLVTTTTTTTKITQKPESLQQNQANGEGFDMSVRKNDAGLLFKSVFDDLPSEFRDILGLDELATSSEVRPEAGNKQDALDSLDGNDMSTDNQGAQDNLGSESPLDSSDSDDESDDNSTPDAVGSDYDSKDDNAPKASAEEDAVSDAVQAVDDKGKENPPVDKDENSGDSPMSLEKPFVVEFAKALDFPSMGAVIEVRYLKGNVDFESLNNCRAGCGERTQHLSS